MKVYNLKIEKPEKCERCEAILVKGSTSTQDQDLCDFCQEEGCVSAAGGDYIYEMLKERK